MILAVDTTTRFAGLALYRQDGIFAEESWFADQNHTVELMPRIHRMLEKAQLKVADLRALAVALGPGSFTGVRIGLAVVKGLALPYKVPMVGIPTLDIVSYPLRHRGLPVWAIVQAGRGRILAVCYDWVDEEWQALDKPQLTNFKALAQKIEQKVLCTGEIDESASQILKETSNQKIQVATPATRTRRAGYLAEIAHLRLDANPQDEPDSLKPIYVSSP